MIDPREQLRNINPDKSAYQRPVEPKQEKQKEPEMKRDEIQNQEEPKSYLNKEMNNNQKYFTKEQVDKLSNMPIDILQSLEGDPARWQYIESLTALNKIKDLSVLGIKQRRFVPGGSNIGALMMRKDDGSQVIDRFVSFTFFRDTKNRIAWAIFLSPKPRAKLLTKFPLIGNWSMFYNRTERIFNTEIAIPSVFGYLSAFDAGTLEQTPLTNDKNIIPLYHKLDREMNQTIQGLILANTEAERLKKRGTFWEKYGVNIMMFLAIIILAIAIYQNASNLAGLKTSITTLGSQVGSLSNLLPKAIGGLPTS